jgi:hypothetical protein
MRRQTATDSDVQNRHSPSGKVLDVITSHFKDHYIEILGKAACSLYMHKHKAGKIVLPDLDQGMSSIYTTHSTPLAQV